MKKALAVTIALAALASFAACGKEPPAEITPETTAQVTPPESESEVKANAPTYDIKKYTDNVIYDGNDYGDIILLYPEIDGNADANELIFKAVRRRCEKALPNLSSYEIGDMPDVTYEITSFSVTYLSDTFLSAKVAGTLTVSLAPHPEPFVYAINVDLENLHELVSADLISDFGKIKEAFINGRFALEDGDEALLAETNAEDMIMQYRSEYEIYPQIWFSSDKLYLNVELVYSLGANAVYSIGLDEAKPCLNTENGELSKIIK